MPKIIIPLQPKSLSETKKLIRKAEKSADIIEVWLDGIANLDKTIISEIVKSTKKPLLLNLKNAKEKGKFKGNSQARFDLLTKSKAAFVDLPLDFPVKLIQQFKRENPKTKLILSHHDFTQTPSLPILCKLAKQAIKQKADVIKLVGFAKNYSDNIPILEISHELAKSKKQFITIAMGEKGEISRILTPLLGGLGMFATLDKQKKTAVGQIEAKQLKQDWKKF
jgi:3-dehydroquinate dehydratase type I